MTGPRLMCNGMGDPKGTTPIIGVTKPHYIVGLVRATGIKLADAEIAGLETLADAANVNTRADWEPEI